MSAWKNTALNVAASKFRVLFATAESQKATKNRHNLHLMLGRVLFIEDILIKMNDRPVIIEYGPVRAITIIMT